MGILGILTVVFVVLKLLNVIAGSWWLVLLPLIIDIVLINEQRIYRCRYQAACDG